MPRPDSNRRVSGLSASVGVHVVLIILLLVAARHAPKLLAPLHMPGTSRGQHIMLSYSEGGPAEVRQSSLAHHSSAVVPQQKVQPSRVLPAPVAASAPVSEAGGNAAGDSALGDENVRIALPQIHPRPQPDLSTLPHGTAGDVVVDVVIDDTGKVTGTTLVKGLGPAVDKTVMDALRGWTFSPATRNGENIASEQEILIHYERG